MGTSTPISTYAISIRMHTSTICPKSNVGHATISTWDATLLHLGGTTNISIQQVSTTSIRPIERRSIRSPDTGPTRLTDYSASKTDQSGRGAYTCSDQTNNKKGYHQNRSADAIIQESEGPMIFGESANTNKIEDTTINKMADPKYSMPRWCPSGLTRSQKRNYNA
jgi:hypothetical protein